MGRVEVVRGEMRKGGICGGGKQGERWGGGGGGGESGKGKQGE